MNHKMWAQWKDFRLDEDYEEPDVMEQLFEVLKEQGYVPGSIKTPSSFKPAMMKYTDRESQRFAEDDVKKMGKELNKASQKAITIMLGSVKNGKYDAMDNTRGIETGQLNRTHEGERPFMKMLWRKVRDGFRRYSKDKKLRK